MCKGIPKLSFLLIFISGYLNIWAQPDQRGGVPLGLLFPQLQNQTSSIHLANDDIIKNAIEQSQSSYGKNGTPYQFGVSIPVSMEISNENLSFLGKDLLVWQKRFKSSGAKAISLIFSRFVIPDNGKLFIYSPDGETILGYFDSKSNTSSKPFVSQFILGDEVIIEYSETIDIQFSFASRADICLNEIVHAFRGFNNFTKGVGDSGGCQVNINCPEGNEWQLQKRGVAKLYLRNGSNWYNCTGSLVNNTSQDGELYFLTADHCGGDASEEDRSVWQFYFGLERPDCDNSADPVNSNYVVGCSLVARAPLDGGSDFQLVKLSQQLPRQVLPYFNGWDRSLTASKSGVGIHHPSGDVKKISTYTRTLTTTTPNISGNVMAVYSAWRVYWTRTETNFGVTEEGSSGSPLFTSNGNIVGTLSGGNSSCSNPIGADFYGKFSFHWASNGSDISQKLQPWLDPLNSNITILNGFDPLVPRNLSVHIDSKVVTLQWEVPLISTDLVGYYVYEDGNLVAQLGSIVNSFTIDYNSKTTITYFVTALYSSPDYQSEPSNTVTADIQTNSPFNENNDDFCRLFPNPSNSKLTVESLKPMQIIRIFSSNGFLIFENSNPDQLIETIDVSTILPGVYLFDMISVDGSRFSHKLIVN